MDRSEFWAGVWVAIAIGAALAGALVEWWSGVAP
jgi:hypothetical protein